MVSRNKQAQKLRVPRVITVRRTVSKNKRGGLDAAGLAYAKLLADPCNAPLVHPTYAGTEGGYLLRADTFFTIAGGAGATSGFLMFSPGLLTDTNVGVLYADGPNPSALQTVVAPTAISLPGAPFLNANASAARCVAACMKISFPGAESVRSGRIHYGQVSSGLITLGGNFAPDAVAQALPFYERTPADIIELVWKPNDADQLFSKPNTSVATDSAKNNKSASLLVAVAGLPAATGLTFHFTAVYEWQPAYATNLSVPNLSKSPSQNTLDEVINYLLSRGYGFVKSYAMSAGRGAMQGIMSEVYGLMGSNSRRRATQQLIGN